MKKQLFILLIHMAQGISLASLATGQAHGQSAESGRTAAAYRACPAASEVMASHLYGTWTATLFAATASTATFTSTPPPNALGSAVAQWTLELGRHDAFADGVFGHLAHGKPTGMQGQAVSGLVSPAGALLTNSGQPSNDRNSAHPPPTELQLLVAGDVDDGVLTLEESADGTTISATWLGEVVPGSCGKTIQGHWSSSASAVRLVFQLVKQAHW